MTDRRFFIDHGMIHDRVTGKHVTTDGEPPFEDSVEQVCDLLNSLITTPATKSAPPILTPRHASPSGERLPSSDAAVGGADTSCSLSSNQRGGE